MSYFASSKLIVFHQKYSLSFINAFYENCFHIKSEKFSFSTHKTGVVKLLVFNEKVLGNALHHTIEFSVESFVGEAAAALCFKFYRDLAPPSRRSSFEELKITSLGNFLLRALKKERDFFCLKS